MTTTKPDATAPDRPSLKSLLAKPVDITVGGITIAVRPLTWWSAADAFEILQPVLEQLPLLASDRDSMLEALLPVAVRNRTEVAEFLAMATDVEFDDVINLSPMHLGELVIGVMEVNADFFVQNLPPFLATLPGRFEALEARLAPLLEQQAT